MAWAGGGAGAALAISATDTDVAEVLADVAEVLADVAGDSAAWCSEGALQPTANNVEHIANTRIGVTVPQSKRESNPAARWLRRLETRETETLVVDVALYVSISR